MTLLEFIQQQIVFHEAQAVECKKGTMMSIAESCWGEVFHRDEVKRLKKIVETLFPDNVQLHSKN